MILFKNSQQKIKSVFFIKGFSLLEVVFVLGILALFGSITGPIYKAVQVKNNLDIATTSVVQALRRAQAQAQNGRLDSNWGVNVTSSSAIVFSGNNYAGRQANYDETLPLPGVATISGLTQEVFNKFTGLPQSVGTTTITNSFGVRQIFINAAGTINY